MRSALNGRDQFEALAKAADYSHVELHSYPEDAQIAKVCCNSSGLLSLVAKVVLQWNLDVSPVLVQMTSAGLLCTETIAWIF